MQSPVFHGKRVLVTGGTGSLGKVLVRRLLGGDMGVPATIHILSRDEAKQHFLRVEYENRVAATDEVIYGNFQRKVQFHIGDVRDYASVCGALRDVDIVINAAAMKQVPTCEYHPHEAVRTNIGGAENIVRAIHDLRLPVETVVGVSTDKACKPVNVMGMTKAIQERIFIQANLRCPGTRFVVTRYGNVLASRGSVIPLFHEQIRLGGPVTITTAEMTRFLLTLDEAVDTIHAAIAGGAPGETWVPRARSANIVDLARALIGDRGTSIVWNGIRPGEKVHEIMISDEEANAAVERGGWYAIRAMLPEVGPGRPEKGALPGEFSSEHHTMTVEETRAALQARGLLVEQVDPDAGELLR